MSIFEALPLAGMITLAIPAVIFGVLAVFGDLRANEANAKMCARCFAQAGTCGFLYAFVSLTIYLMERP